MPWSLRWAVLWLSCPAAAGVDVGQSPALPGRRSRRRAPCQAQIPLFLASWLLSDKVLGPGELLSEITATLNHVGSQGQ